MVKLSGEKLTYKAPSRENERSTAEQCSRISFNPMFGEFETVRVYCQLFLTNCISFDYKNDLKLFAFLLPMEYVFEDFILFH